MDEHRATWRDYIERHLVPYDRNVAALAAKAGLQRSIVSQWVNKGTQPSLENARKFANGVGVPLLQVLVAAGLITEEEAKLRAAAPPDAGKLSNEELVDELQRRLARAAGGKVRKLQPVVRAAYPKDMDK